MCGIFFSISHGAALEPDEKTLTALKARGPDAFRQLILADKIAVNDTAQKSSVYLTFCSSVLGLRGRQLHAQPLVDSASGSVFCWNGEAWKYRGIHVLGNDSAALFEHLLSHTSSSSAIEGLIDVMSSVSGPFAFVFYHAPSHRVFYGRDRLGRRSLVVNQPDKHTLTLCSISTHVAGGPVEIDTTMLYSISLDSDIPKQYHNWRTVPPSINYISPSSAIAQTPSEATVELLLTRLSNSLQLRVLDIPDHGSQSTESSRAKVAILFSGGLDCTLLARLVHDILPPSEPVDLLNVAFQNPRSLQNLPASADPYESCPDRRTGRCSFNSLSAACPARTWRFVAIDITYSLLLVHRPTISSLMQPHNTEMDLSIASALYFAARGVGESTISAQRKNSSNFYTTPARILLSGFGADELFGGYARHAAAFRRASYGGLVNELDLDITRIGQRNLGRDDRVMSHWGKEVRYPYLDEDFLKFALELPVWEKTGFRERNDMPKHHEMTDGVAVQSSMDLPSDKMLLRLVMWKLGMRGVAGEKKRAIQFGARTAKMESGKGRKKGTDIVDD